MSASGEVLQRLSEEDVTTSVDYLLSQGVESVVIHFLHSYVNDANERDCAAVVRKLWPNQ